MRRTSSILNFNHLREVGPSRKILHARGVGSERRKSETRGVGSWGALGATRQIKFLSLISHLGRSRDPQFWVRVCALAVLSFKFNRSQKVTKKRNYR